MATAEKMLETLRGEIFAAQVKVILDQRLGRETSRTVTKLAELKLPPRARSQKSLPETVEQEGVRLTRKEQLLETLRGEIFAAQVKVILDQRLGRETSATVKKLAELTLPPGVRHSGSDPV